MLCPYCGKNESDVLESRDAKEEKAIRRRRECVSCGKRFTTYEEVRNIELKVIKKDGRIEDFNREKLGKCLDKACWKMTIDEKLSFISDIEMKLLNWKSVEIPSKEIGLLILEKLKGIDPVAYIRFATVYLDIRSVKDFHQLLIDFEKFPPEADQPVAEITDYKKNRL